MTLKRAYASGSGSVGAGDITREMYAEAAGMPVVRRGASTIGDGGSNRASVVWAPTATDYTMRITACHPDGYHAGFSYIIGRDVNGYDALAIDAAGAILIRSSQGTLLSITDGFPNDDLPHEYELQREGTTLTARIDGEVIGVATGGFPASTTPSWHYFHPIVDNTVTVAWDAWLIDPNSDANTAYFALDVQNAAGGYDNTYPGSTVADSGVNGTVLPVEINALTAGSGVPVCEGPVVVMFSRTTAQSMTAASTRITVTPVLDPYGWDATSNSIPVPIAGVGLATLTGRIRATALAGASNEPEMLLYDLVGGTAARQAITLDTVNAWVSFSLTAVVEVDAGDELVGIVNLNPSGDTIEVDDVTLTLTLDPDLS